MEKEKIRFKNLSGWLKFGIVGGWATMVVYITSFLIGFLIGMLEL
jgi:hypothetical protein